MRIVIELDTGPDFYVRICRPQFFDLTEINAGMKTIVIGKRDVTEPTSARAVDPRLQKILGIRLDPMALRMSVVI